MLDLVTRNDVKMKKLFSVILLLSLSLCNIHIFAQDTTVFSTSSFSIQINDEEEQQDTTISNGSVDLENIPDLRTKFNSLNSQYSVPQALGKKLEEIKNADKLEMSEEALYWINKMYDRSNEFDSFTTFADTIIINPLFMPITFEGNFLPKDLSFFSMDSVIPKYNVKPLYQPETIFADYTRIRNNQIATHEYVEQNHPEYFRYSYNILPKDAVKTNVIKKHISGENLIVVNNDADFSDVTAPTKFIPERRYWTSSFQSDIQFAQNYISPNWHKGGTSNFNLNNREYFIYNYNKDKVQFTNELEIKNTITTAPNDTLRSYKVSDDVFRLHSNLGFRAFSKWFYTIDMEFKTQLFSSFGENTETKLAGLLSPYSINVGLGMKYDLAKTFPNPKKKLTMSINIAPISYTFRQTIDKDIDLSRHFTADKVTGEYPTKLSQVGSTINATMTFQISRNVNWYSRFYYNTNYQRIEGEFENRLSMAISRFFSTIITLNLRYDDGVTKNPDFDSYLQINEQLSFGFSYKW